VIAPRGLSPPSILTRSMNGIEPGTDALENATTPALGDQLSR
jgi:hypothetical protein